MRKNKGTKRASYQAITATCALAALIGCSANGSGPPNDEAVDVSESALASAPVRYPLGSIPDSPALIRSKMLMTPLVSPLALRPLVLPTSVDLSSELPPVGNQGEESSCVGWAVGYNTKTLQEVVEDKWPPDATDHEFSAAWIYNQINHGVDGGSSVSDALNLLVNLGADTLSSFNPVVGDVTTQPSAASLSRAAHYKAASWYTLAVSASNLKTVLAGGNTVIVTINVLPDLNNLNGTSNTVYDTDSGTRSAISFSCTGATCSSTCASTCNSGTACGVYNAGTQMCNVPACNAAPCISGNHAVAIVGYDDTAQTFKFVNQWGTGFGSNGFGWFAYSFINNSNLSMVAYVLNDAANVPGLQDSTMTWLESSRPLFF